MTPLQPYDPPDPDLAMLAWLAAPGVTVLPERPADLLARVPLLLITPIPASSPHPGLHDRAIYNVQTIHTSRKKARDLLTGARARLWSAWHHQTPAGGLVLNQVREDEGPNQVTSGLPDGLWRWSATWAVSLQTVR